MRAHFIHGLIGAKVMTIDYVPSQDNPADALTKGLTAAVHNKAKLLLCLEELDQSYNTIPLQGQGECAC
eukprot:12301927-Prorocentrum_lima.AAC.1